jgi:CRP/FNR family cyclic AMP-dependent transcriptional regulator
MEKSSLKPGHLRRIKSLALLSDEQLTAFLNHIEVMECAQNASLFREGQPGDSMYLILEGQMRVSTQKKNSGGALFLRMLEAGDSFGEIALISHAPRTATVEATQRSVLIKISAAHLQKLISEQPALAAQFLFHVAKTLGRQLTDLTVKLRAHTEQADMLSHC